MENLQTKVILPYEKFRIRLDINGMNLTEVVAFVTGLLQFTVACYALRLDRQFGVSRVGWSLFCAFFLMALLHLGQSLMPSVGMADLGVTMNVMYALISLLLLTSMAHLETVLKERARVEQAERQLRTELEWEVQKKTACLMRAIEELETEMDERKQAEAAMRTTGPELHAVSRIAGSAKATAAVLRSVKTMLKSVNASAGAVSDQVKQSKIANVVHIGVLLREHSADLGRFMAHDPRGRKLPEHIAQLGRHLAREQAVLSAELESIRKNIEHIKEILVRHERCASFARAHDPTPAISLAGAIPRMSTAAA